jgi:hypothetical protein
MNTDNYNNRARKGAKNGNGIGTTDGHRWTPIPATMGVTQRRKGAKKGNCIGNHRFTQMDTDTCNNWARKGAKAQRTATAI